VTSLEEYNIKRQLYFWQIPNLPPHLFLVCTLSTSFYFVSAQAVTLEILLCVVNNYIILLNLQQLKKTFIKEHCNGHLCVCKLNHDCMTDLQLYH